MHKYKFAADRYAYILYSCSVYDKMAAHEKQNILDQNGVNMKTLADEKKDDELNRISKDNNHKTSKTLVIIISLAFIIDTVAAIIVLPITSKRIIAQGNSVFIMQFLAAIVSAVLAFIFLLFYKYFKEGRTIWIYPKLEDFQMSFVMGMLNVVSFIFIMYGSPPSRVPQYLFSILQTSAIPMTVLCKYILFRQGMCKWHSVRIS